MKKINLLLIAFVLSGISFAQNIGFQNSGEVKFINSQNDTIPYPFTGGFTAPQFNTVDINLDGKMDLLVFDRKDERLHPYINEGGPGQVKYRYAPEYRNNFPAIKNWIRMADYNRDGKVDIFTGANPQDGIDSGMIVQNNHVRIFKNVSTATELKFNLLTIKLTGTIPQQLDSSVYVSPIDYPAIDDMDGDGDIDILSMEAIGGNVFYYKNLQVERALPKEALSFYQVDRCWGSMVILSQVALGTSCQKYYLKTAAHLGTSLSVFDPDGDGDMDLYAGDNANSFVYFIKNGKKELNWKYGNFSADTAISADTLYPKNTRQIQMPTQLATFFIDLNNDGKKDMLVAPGMLSGIKTKNHIWYYQNTGTSTAATFSYVQNNFLLDQTIDLGDRFAPALLDYNRDGKMDLLVGTRGDWEENKNQADHLLLYKNVGTSTKPVFQLADTNYLNIKALQLTSIKPATGDLNHDNKPDIMLGSSNGTLVFLENKTDSAATELQFLSPAKDFQRIKVSAESSPGIYDMNFDGWGDLLVGNDIGLTSYFRNKGELRKVMAFDSVPVVDSLGLMIAKTKNKNNTYPFLGRSFATVFDYGNDKKLEIALGQADGVVRCYRVNAVLESKFELIDTILMNQGESRYGNRIGLNMAIPLVGHFDADTIPDMLVGYENGGLLYYKGVYRGNLTPIGFGYDTVKIWNTSIRSVSNSNIKVYPNPFTNELYIEGIKGHVTYTLFNMMGTTILHGSTEDNEIRQLPLLAPGVYLLQVKTDEEQGTIKLLRN